MSIRTDSTPRPIATAGNGAPIPRPQLAGSPQRPAAGGRPAPRKPDPTPARFALAAGGIATVSALLAAIGSAAVPSAASVVPTALPAAALPVQTIVKYVYLQPGKATPAPALAAVVAPPAPRAIQAPVVTRQSGAKP